MLLIEVTVCMNCISNVFLNKLIAKKLSDPNNSTRKKKSHLHPLHNMWKESTVGHCGSSNTGRHWSWLVCVTGFQ